MCDSFILLLNKNMNSGEEYCVASLFHAHPYIISISIYKYTYKLGKCEGKTAC